MRKSGYYWVKLKKSNEWIPGKYTTSYKYADDPFWEIIACDWYLKENDFEEVGKSISIPK